MCPCVEVGSKGIISILGQDADRYVSLTQLYDLIKRSVKASCQ